MARRLIFNPSIPLLLLVALATNAVHAVDKTWTTSSFLDFIGGELEDGGVNTYVAADGTVRLINLCDLNNDGNFDLPIACAQNHDEETETFIYWADEDGFAPQRRGEVPTHGAIGAAAIWPPRTGTVRQARTVPLKSWERTSPTRSESIAGSNTRRRSWPRVVSIPLSCGACRSSMRSSKMLTPSG